MKGRCINPEVGRLLHSYELGLLTSEEDERFERHLLSCDHCHTELHRFETHAKLLRSHQAVRREVAAPDAVATSFGSRLRHWLWPDAPLLFRPAITLLLVVVLMYPAWLGIHGISRGGRIAPVYEISLLPVRGAGSDIFTVPAERDLVLEFVCYGCNVGEPYRVDIADAEGNLLHRTDGFDGFDEFEMGRLLLPAHLVSPGRYILTVSDLSTTPPADRQQYVFRIVE